MLLLDKPSNRYNTGRWPHPDGPSGMWRDRKHDERYYSRESQESPWEDEYSNEAEEISTSHYLTAKRNWKRPSSASEMDRKTGEIRSRHYLATGKERNFNIYYFTNRNIQEAAMAKGTEDINLLEDQGVAIRSIRRLPTAIKLTQVQHLEAHTETNSIVRHSKTILLT